VGKNSLIGNFKPYLTLEGYEIIEILPDAENIMANSGGGGIHRYHFTALVGGTYFRSGLALANVGDHEAAVVAYRKTIEISGDASNITDAYNNLGWSLKQLRKYEAAIIALEIAIEMRPDWSLACNNLSEVHKILKEQGEN